MNKTLSYPEFVRLYPYLSTFGIICTLFSSFGQTFFVSLFVPSFNEAFQISNASFGLLYSGATVLSATTLIWIGKWIDHTTLKKYVLLNISILLVAVTLLSAAWILPVLFIGLYFLRLGFQGLLTHTAHTTMARYFVINRGKALSLANLGYPVGEAFLPLVGAIVIVSIGWRMSWVVVGLLIFLIMLPLVLWLLSNIPADPKEIQTADGMDSLSDDEIRWTRRLVIRDPRFYKILPLFIASPFLLTGLFLFQVSLAEFKGWSVELIATAFIMFAAGRIIFSLIGGPLIDRFSAKKLFPYMLIPSSIGLLVISFSVHPWVAFFYMLMLGMSEGLASGIKTALWAEIYGVKSLGAIRSLMSFVIIFGTAISPFLFGYLIDAGVSFNHITLGSVVYIGLATALGAGIRKT